MRLHWHPIGLLLCTLGLWWWGVQEPPPEAPWPATVVGHDVDDGYAKARVDWTGPDGTTTFASLARRGLRHEPGQVVAVYPVEGDSGVVEEWTGHEWPWLGWLLALTLAHGLGVLASLGVPKPRLQACAGSAVVLCGLALLWYSLFHAIEDRVELLQRGALAQAVVADGEIMSPGSGRARARVDAIVHFAATAAQPPRDVQVNFGTRWQSQGTRIPLLYLPETPTRVLVLGKSGSTVWAWAALATRTVPE